MSNQISVVQAFIAAINRRSPREMADLMTEDHTFVDSAGRIESGRETMTAGWDAYFRMFPDYAIRIESILGDSELVAVFGFAAGTYKGKRGCVPANRIEMPAAWRAVVEKGKVKVWQVYADWTEGTRIIAEDTAVGEPAAALDAGRSDHEPAQVSGHAVSRTLQREPS
jgi:limonene-1,2-epoxide hydrolase